MTPSPSWAEIDAFLAGYVLPEDPALEAVLAANAAAQLPAIDVSPLQGRLLTLLAVMAGAKSVLEIGTLGGYSTICLARAVGAQGHVLTLEANARHAEVAQANLVRAGVADRVTLRLGPALETLATLGAADGVPFDFVFIDADKPNTPYYFDEAMRLARVGTVILCDNVVRAGGVLDASGTDPRNEGNRLLLTRLQQDPRVNATVVQTVGSKGHDGFALVRVNAL